MYVASAAQVTKTEPGTSGLDPKYSPWNQFDAISLMSTGATGNTAVGKLLIEPWRERGNTHILYNFFSLCSYW